MTVLSLLVVEHEDKGRDGKEVQKMDSDRKSHKERDEHDPSVCVWSIRLLVPFYHSPENEGCEQ